MNTKAKKQEETILNCLANLPPDEKPIFVDIIMFVGHHPGSERLLSEAVTKGLKELSEMFAYMQDNWLDPEPSH